MSNPNRRVVDGAATFGATSCENGDGDEASAEENVKNEAEESEEGDAAEEAGKDNGEPSVDDGGSRHALHSLLPCWDMEVMVR